MHFDSTIRRKRYARQVAVLAFWRVMKADISNVFFRQMVINGHAKVCVDGDACLYLITPAGVKYAEGVSVCQ